MSSFPLMRHATVMNVVMFFVMFMYFYEFRGFIKFVDPLSSPFLCDSPSNNPHLFEPALLYCSHFLQVMLCGLASVSFLTFFKSMRVGRSSGIRWWHVFPSDQLESQASAHRYIL